MIDSLARLPAQHRHGLQGKDALIDLQVDDSGDSSPVRLAEPQTVGGFEPPSAFQAAYGVQRAGRLRGTLVLQRHAKKRSTLEAPFSSNLPSGFPWITGSEDIERYVYSAHLRYAV